MIHIEELNIKRKDRVILVIRELTLPETGLFLISGDNGTGKTSLIRSILHMHTGYSGQIHIDGRNNREMTRTDLASIISYLPQSVTTEADFSVEEFIRQGQYASPGKYHDEVVSLLGIKSLLERRYTELSGGEKQLCRLARVLIPDTGYVFLDEPDSFLSRKNRVRLLKCLRAMSQIRSVLVITHYGADYPDAVHLLDLELAD